MGCPISIPSGKTQSPNIPQNFGQRNEEKNVENKPPLRQETFIHKMLRPQLDPAVPPIGFTKWQSVGGTLTTATDWMKRRYSVRQRNNATMRVDETAADSAQLAETASLESCLARVISMRDEFVHQHGGAIMPRNQSNVMTSNTTADDPNRHFLHSQQQSPQPSITSALSSDASPLGGQQENLQNICGTAVTFEWLFQRLAEKFKCPEEPEPQWIVEKMNDIGDRDLDRTTVLRITFGWENAKLPKSVVLKICQRHEDDPPEAKLTECLTYEWLSKHRRVAIPQIFVIKKQWSRSCNALLVMEDLSEKAQISELGADIAIEGVRDLLRVLAQLHALSMVYREEWHGQLDDGAQLPPFLYEQIGRFASALITAAASSSAEVLDIERVRQQLGPLMSASRLEQLTTQSCAQLGVPECLVHGHPIGRNVFFRHNNNNNAINSNNNNNNGEEGGKEETKCCSSTTTTITTVAVQALIDWTQAHCGCFGEDLAKAICWNMDGVKRRDAEQLLKLLQYYHYQLLKKLQYHGAPLELQKAITLEKVQSAYERFVPAAAVIFLLFLPEELSHADPALLERAQQLLAEAATSK